MATTGPDRDVVGEKQSSNGSYNNGAGTSLDRTRTAPTHAAFGGAFQPGAYSETRFRKFANPAPLGLSAFALTTFVLSLVNVQARGVKEPNIVIGLAFGYGGLVQLLAGMWEFAVGNTFGATALSSYGGFWISYAIIISGGAQSYGIVEAYPTTDNTLQSALGFYLIGWFIFTFIMTLGTLRSTLAFFSLFFMLTITFLLLAIGHFQLVHGAENVGCIKAGGVFGLLTAFIAWYNALAGLLERSNSFFMVPVIHFPWSDKIQQERAGNRAANEHTA